MFNSKNSTKCFSAVLRGKLPLASVGNLENCTENITGNPTEFCALFFKMSKWVWKFENPSLWKERKNVFMTFFFLTRGKQIRSRVVSEWY